MASKYATSRQQRQEKLDQARGKAERAFFQRLEEAKHREAYLSEDAAELTNKYFPTGGN